MCIVLHYNVTIVVILISYRYPLLAAKLDPLVEDTLDDP